MTPQKSLVKLQDSAKTLCLCVLGKLKMNVCIKKAEIQKREDAGVKKRWRRQQTGVYVFIKQYIYLGFCFWMRLVLNLISFSWCVREIRPSYVLLTFWETWNKQTNKTTKCSIKTEKSTQFLSVLAFCIVLFLDQIFSACENMLNCWTLPK